MFDAAIGAFRAPEDPNPPARADALEREITDLCAHINAASYRLRLRESLADLGGVRKTGC